MLHILSNLTPEYDVVLDGLESKLDATGNDKLTVLKIREKLGARYLRIKEHWEDDENPHEKALITHPQGDDQVRNQYGDYVKPWKGTCRSCGKYGHKSTDCPNKKVFKGRCNICGKWGHKQQDCQETRRFTNNGKCWFCDKEGHKVFECEEMRELKKNREATNLALNFPDLGYESLDEIGF